ncbi:hypothetical protein MXL91_20340 [Achromobacter ruhlandii]|uniref:hypothetical protein n=1 Tax=Achromobacter ruhlandii TaxID=72557 RepID=UPI002DBB085E|nr:hypothetical protein [Achromobacter ruhlandii]MEB6663816.1 hypothetical protein [Achromobacter ruhlandii]
MMDIIKANNLPLTGETPTIDVIHTAQGAYVDLNCDRRDESIIRDAFKAVGQRYTAQPQFFPDWKML